ncbi:3-phosphoshikimate 1-carboxyvinyltransferase [Flavobacterium salilacus subsp. salilacus]|uniref:3-phosphoshikimate 1-carboxyvinyltransferase n=1 Tax=Flavobacterium TaxID=237 RepID=UPI001074C25B|nr:MULTISPECIES: 3-phosphoshikimate 1-carboxyvinyltransferase [Flavobacterium]KAF2519906.1 3-phosphoshikimate 1-carboxyvinyltransferase [Flavobacterium salilacus subsp. salilacus]MBE1614186.1 3-phosphoshikimate 1-carboxyvinyltransferase [Flavobacterium sp. SaA2.13]
MDIKINPIKTIQSAELVLSGSKSETNRLLLLQALFPQINIQNISDSDDSTVMQEALNSTADIINVHHAGTAMRFLTAYFAMQEGREIVLTGSERMKQRPIGIVVKALNNLGAQITYTDKEGYPPLKIVGKKLTKSKVSINANVSSQYITALLLIGSKLENGLEITLEGEITSLPYINMTLALLKEAGIVASMNDNRIEVKPKTESQISVNLVVESDWSSASYFYAILALSPLGSTITLSSFKQNSFQGDAALAEIYTRFGVTTIFNNNAITLSKTKPHQPSIINLSLNNTPDIAQTIAVTCLGLGMACHLTGLHTLKIKEADRLEALKTELEKFGATVTVTQDSLTLQQHNLPLNEGVSVATYNDHRMAMAFAPLALKTAITINNAEVVSKSYPAFWDDIEKLGFTINRL